MKSIKRLLARVMTVVFLFVNYSPYAVYAAGEEAYEDNYVSYINYYLYNTILFDSASGPRYLIDYANGKILNCTSDNYRMTECTMNGNILTITVYSDEFPVDYTYHFDMDKNRSVNKTFMSYGSYNDFIENYSIEDNTLRFDTSKGPLFQIDLINKKIKDCTSSGAELLSLETIDNLITVKVSSEENPKECEYCFDSAVSEWRIEDNIEDPINNVSFDKNIITFDSVWGPRYQIDYVNERIVSCTSDNSYLSDCRIEGDNLELTVCSDEFSVYYTYCFKLESNEEGAEPEIKSINIDEYGYDMEKVAVDIDDPDYRLRKVVIVSKSDGEELCRLIAEDGLYTGNVVTYRGDLELRAYYSDMEYLSENVEVKRRDASQRKIMIEASPNGMYIDGSVSVTPYYPVDGYVLWTGCGQEGKFEFGGSTQLDSNGKASGSNTSESIVAGETYYYYAKLTDYKDSFIIADDGLTNKKYFVAGEEINEEPVVEIKSVEITEYGYDKERVVAEITDTENKIIRVIIVKASDGTELCKLTKIDSKYIGDVATCYGALELRAYYSENEYLSQSVELKRRDVAQRNIEIKATVSGMYINGTVSVTPYYPVDNYLLWSGCGKKGFEFGGATRLDENGRASGSNTSVHMVSGETYYYYAKLTDEKDSFIIADDGLTEKKYFVAGGEAEEDPGLGIRSIVITEYGYDKEKLVVDIADSDNRIEKVVIVKASDGTELSSLEKNEEIYTGDVSTCYGALELRAYYSDAEFLSQSVEIKRRDVSQRKIEIESTARGMYIFGTVSVTPYYPVDNYILWSGCGIENSFEFGGGIHLNEKGKASVANTSEEIVAGESYYYYAKLTDEKDSYIIADDGLTKKKYFVAGEEGNGTAKVEITSLGVTEYGYDREMLKLVCKDVDSRIAHVNVVVKADGTIIKVLDKSSEEGTYIGDVPTNIGELELRVILSDGTCLKKDVLIRRRDASARNIAVSVSGNGTFINASAQVDPYYNVDGYKLAICYGEVGDETVTRSMVYIGEDGTGSNTSNWHIEAGKTYYYYAIVTDKDGEVVLAGDGMDSPYTFVATSDEEEEQRTVISNIEISEYGYSFEEVRVYLSDPGKNADKLIIVKKEGGTELKELRYSADTDSYNGIVSTAVGDLEAWVILKDGSVLKTAVERKVRDLNGRDVNITIDAKGLTMNAYAKVTPYYAIDEYKLILCYKETDSDQEYSKEMLLSKDGTVEIAVSDNIVSGKSYNFYAKLTTKDNGMTIANDGMDCPYSFVAGNSKQKSEKYAVRFFVNDVMVANEYVEAGGIVENIPDDPAEEGVFTGWYYDNTNTLWDRSLPIYKNIDLEAGFVTEDENRGSGLDGRVVIEPEEDLYVVKGQKFDLDEEGKWSSDNSNVISISKKYKAVAKGAGAACLSAVIDGVTNTVNVIVVEPQIDAGCKKMTLVTGASAECKLQGIDEDFEDYYDVYWTSSKPEVAKVNDGMVYALSKGTATISAYINGKAYKASVKVTDTENVKSMAGQVVLKPLQKVNVKFSDKYSVKGAEWTSDLDMQPIYAKNGKITGYQDGVVMITTSGKMTAVGAGISNLTVDNGKESRSIQVVVEEPKSKLVYLNAGKSTSIRFYNVKNSAGIWSTEGGGNKIVNIGKNGKINAIEAGITTVNCKYDPYGTGGFTFKAIVCVEDPKLKVDDRLKGTVPTYSIDMNVGEQYVLQKEGIYQPICFTSNKEKVAFVDEAGIISARGIGKAKLTTRVNGKKITVIVNVKE